MRPVSSQESTSPVKEPRARNMAATRERTVPEDFGSWNAKRTHISPSQGAKKKKFASPSWKERGVKKIKHFSDCYPSH
ncbi:hypothetical protein TNIN_105181 [Trichonephila inaurata madagascariensis]|uniref:Uncharacterized protein n=1 Tax=Trichonephila inaurata madagascariensis TaxID=2747483 RepID=A0A8X6Y413_9ARAC|nr:hypothetical protein TNIN_105181 [Trichonephila inaurata madagascariensis]